MVGLSPVIMTPGQVTRVREFIQGARIADEDAPVDIARRAVSWGVHIERRTIWPLLGIAVSLETVTLLHLAFGISPQQARVIIGYVLAHMVLQTLPPLEVLAPASLRHLRAMLVTESQAAAAWYAASLMLIPDREIERDPTATAIAERCGVTVRLAERRLGGVELMLPEYARPVCVEPVREAPRLRLVSSLERQSS
jgi:hypothetical protein